MIGGLKKEEGFRGSSVFGKRSFLKLELFRVSYNMIPLIP